MTDKKMTVEHALTLSNMVETLAQVQTLLANVAVDIGARLEEQLAGASVTSP